MIKNKPFLRWLRKQSAVLPPEKYIAYAKERMDNPLPGHPSVTMSNEVECDVNHFRRMKRIWYKEGYAGVEKYFMDRDFMIMDRNKKEPQ